MTGRTLTVRMNDHVVGHLHEANDLWAFEYAASWLARPGSFDLSPALPRRSASTHEPALHRDGASLRPVQWYFDNLLPEEALRSVLAAEAAIDAEDAFGLLACFGAESAGSLVLQSPTDKVEVATGLKPLPLDELSRRIGQLPTVSLTWQAPKRMSLAGAQHKMLLVVADGQLFEPLPGTPSTHILKPNHWGDDYPASVMNEFFTMRLARAVGLAVPSVQRLYVPQPVYIVERFDRVQPQADSALQGATSRLHAIDACQLLNKSRSFKYTAATLASLADAVAQCRAKAATRLQLYTWLIFNLLLGNADNHLKNISFRVDASGIALAPAYDLLSTAVYDTRALAQERARWPATPLAFVIGEATTFETVTRQHVLDAGTALGLSAATARRELDRLVKAVPMAADGISADIEAGLGGLVEASPQPDTARLHGAAERLVLRAIRHIVVPEMVRQLS